MGKFPDHLLALNGVKSRTEVDKGVWQTYEVIVGAVGGSEGGMPLFHFWPYRQTCRSPVLV